MAISRATSRLIDVNVWLAMRRKEERSMRWQPMGKGSLTELILLTDRKTVMGENTTRQKTEELSTNTSTVIVVISCKQQGE